MLFRSYVYDASGNPLSGSSAASKISITNTQGSFTYGSTQVFTGSKAVVNFTSQVVVPAASGVTLSVRFDAADAYYPGQFVIAINSQDDIYAVDSNVFSQVSVSALPGFPLESSPVTMQEKADSCAFSGFVSEAPQGMLKGQSNEALISFDFADTNGASSAATEFTGVTFTVRNSSGAQIAANSALSQMYLVSAAGVTVSAASAGVSPKVFMNVNPAMLFTSGMSAKFTLYGSVPAGASAAGFTLSLEQASDTGSRDSNSKTEAVKTFNQIGRASCRERV